MLHDSVATFYGGYDQVGLVRSRRLHVPLVTVAICVAAVALLVLIAADVSAYEARPVPVDVTEVNWYAEGELLGSEAGFSIHSSEVFTLSLSCAGLCYKFNGATASSPFHVVSVAIEYQPIEYVNATVLAPPSGYSGPLIMTLGVV